MEADVETPVIGDSVSETTRPAYIVSITIFILWTLLEGAFPQKYYPVLYGFKTLSLTACLVMYRSALRDFRPDWRVVLPAVLVGLFVLAIWIPVDRMTPYHFAMGKRSAFNPDAAISEGLPRYLFIAVRFYGLVVLVPIIEELFWRSYLLREFSATDGDFRSLRIGEFTWGAFASVDVAFALAHPEWLSALICAAAYGLLLWRTRSLYATLIAHAITNLGLGIYILQNHAWTYW